MTMCRNGASSDRLFGVRQGCNVRPVDDLPESLVKMSFGSSNRVSLGGIDELAILARTMLQAAKPDRSVEVTLPTGRGAGHARESLSVDDAKAMAGRTLDLDAAYKQLSVSASSLWAAVVKTYNTERGNDELYVSQALSFGAASAVPAFNVQARANRKLGTRLFGMMWTKWWRRENVLSPRLRVCMAN